MQIMLHENAWRAETGLIGAFRAVRDAFDSISETTMRHVVRLLCGSDRTMRLYESTSQTSDRPVVISWYRLPEQFFVGRVIRPLIYSSTMAKK